MSNTSFESAVTIKGQVTIPKELRDKLHIAPGDKVKFFMDANNRLFVLPPSDVRQLRGIVKPPHGKPLTIEQLNEAAAASWTAREDRRRK